VLAGLRPAGPVEATRKAMAHKARHRLPRGGDRQLNLALHVIALNQVRMRASPGRAYYDRKIGEGKTHNEAMRCLIGQVSGGGRGQAPAVARGRVGGWPRCLAR
jgi:hypothetical protein